MHSRIARLAPLVLALNAAHAAEFQWGDFEVTFKVRSTKDTGNHRDCCG